MTFVDDARKAWRWISVQSMVAALALQGAWQAIPDEMKASIPSRYVAWATAALMVLGLVGRLVKQSPKDKP